MQDLTRLESGNETSFNEPFDLQATIEEATYLYRNEAERRNIMFQTSFESPTRVVGDSRKIRTVVQNLMANARKCRSNPCFEEAHMSFFLAVKYTSKGSITVRCKTFAEPDGLRDPKQTAVEITVADTGCGIPADKLDNIFREFEQVEISGPQANTSAVGEFLACDLLGHCSNIMLGLGLAVVARIVQQLGGQLRVDSKVNEGSQFSFLIPLSLSSEAGSELSLSPRSSHRTSIRLRSRASSTGSSEIDSLVEALASNHMISQTNSTSAGGSLEAIEVTPAPTLPIIGVFPVTDSNVPVRPIKVDDFHSDRDYPSAKDPPQRILPSYPPNLNADRSNLGSAKLRILLVEVGNTDSYVAYMLIYL